MIGNTLHNLLSRFLFMVMLVVFFAATSVNAGDFTTTSASASSTYTGWLVSYVYDGVNSTSWSSALHGSSGYTEWLKYFWSTAQNTNYIKIMPRYYGAALCFPADFKIYTTSNGGTSWTLRVTMADYPNPTRNDWIIIPLAGTCSANGIKIEATELRQDGWGNYAFQLAEAKGGYNSEFAKLTYNGNSSALTNKIQITGDIGPGAFNPNKLNNWNYDERGALFEPSGTYRNVYSTQAVYLGGSTWRLYYHGYDLSSDGVYDRIYTTVTYDNWGTFDTRYMIVNHGDFWNVGNECVVWLSANEWYMSYTCGIIDGQQTTDKTGYSTSTDGANWTPSQGDYDYMFTVTGYPDWANGQYNGVNPIIKVGNTWHYYFMDSRYNDGVEHATSTNFVNYTWQNEACVWGVAMNDIRALSFGGTTYYPACYHTNSNKLYMTCGTSLTNLGDPVQIIELSANEYMPTCCWVQDGSKIIGILYGHTTDPDLWDNRIYAQWLQKKLVFSNASVSWEDEFSLSPSIERLDMNAGYDVETGTLKVYDTDGTTLLWTSPTFSMREGDVYTYNE